MYIVHTLFRFYIFICRKRKSACEYLPEFFFFTVYSRYELILQTNYLISILYDRIYLYICIYMQMNIKKLHSTYTVLNKFMWCLKIYEKKTNNE